MCYQGEAAMSFPKQAFPTQETPLPQTEEFTNEDGMYSMYSENAPMVYRRRFIAPSILNENSEKKENQNQSKPNITAGSNAKTRKCKLCGKNFTYNYELRAHMRRHAKEISKFLKTILV